MREPTILLVQILVQEEVLSLNHEPLFFLWSNLVNPNLMGSVTLIQPTAISCIINTVSLFFSGIQDRPQEPHQYYRGGLWKVPCGYSSRASDRVPHITDQFIAYTGNTDLAILLNKDTCETDPMVLALKEDSTSKGTWGMVLLIVRGLLRRPSLSGTPTVPCCSVMSLPRSVTHPLIYFSGFHGYMRQHNVDFIGGDFNVSAISTVGDVFSDPEFSAPGNSFLWDLVRWRSRIVSVLGFSQCQSVHMSGVWIHMATQRLASDLVINALTSLCSYISVPLTCLAPTASCAVKMRNNEGLSADITNTSV